MTDMDLEIGEFGLDGVGRLNYKSHCRKWGKGKGGKRVCRKFARRGGSRAHCRFGVVRKGRRKGQCLKNRRARRR